MNSYSRLMKEIQDLGYEVSYINNTIEVKSDIFDDEYIAIIWIKDSTIMADNGGDTIALCDLSDKNRESIIEKFLEDPWNYDPNTIYDTDLPY